MTVRERAGDGAMRPVWFDPPMPQFGPFEDADGGQNESLLTVFGGWIRETRRALGLTQAAFGRRVGLHQSTISRLERGLVPYLAFPTAIRLLVVVLDTLLPRR